MPAHGPPPQASTTTLAPKKLPPVRQDGKHLDSAPGIFLRIGIGSSLIGSIPFLGGSGGRCWNFRKKAARTL